MMNSTLNHLVLEAFKTFSNSDLIVYTKNGVMVVEENTDSFNWIKLSYHKRKMEFKNIEFQRINLLQKAEIEKLKNEILMLKKGDS